MMIRNLLVLAVALVATAGCSSSEDPGDVAGATKAIAAGPKSVEQLPENMPKEAKASAAAAMGQAAAVQQQMSDPARARAMEEMRKQRGG
jgi:hypothetical protein